MTLDKITPLGRRFKSGSYYRGDIWGIASNTAAAVTAGHAYYVPFSVAQMTTFNEMSLYVTALTAYNASTQIARLNLGVYADDGYGYPGSKLFSEAIVQTEAGSPIAASARTVTTTMNLTLAPGYYFLASLSNGTGVMPSTPIYNTGNVSIGNPQVPMGDATTAPFTTGNFVAHYFYQTGLTGTAALPAAATPLIIGGAAHIALIKAA